MNDQRTTAVITGASSGIGLALAERWAAEGRELVLVARSREKLEAIAQDLGSRHGVRVDVVVADLADPAGPDAVVDALEAKGLEVETLINNAGAGWYGAFAATDLARDLAMVRLNVDAAVVLTKRLLPGMLARGRGHIVNVASIAAFAPGPRRAIYYATKAFLVSFSEGLLVELDGTGVAVTAVCPGPVTSGFHAAAGMRQQPGFYKRFMIPASVVADATWHGVQRRRFLVVPGFRHRVLFALVRWMPRGLVRRGARGSE